ncbi:YciI family protein [Actinoplanes sp. NPDC049596]|uniref:YciI family protein n=1 Tax=unclassified Actinoplanes TaxID=2626549 RepID=UPI003412D693
MRYLTLLRAKPSTTPPPPELMAAIMALGEDATKAGALLDTAGLEPSATGARVALTAGELAATDGPFAESKEVISYAIYEVASKQEAVEWASRFLRAHRDLWPGWEGEVDVLKLFG